MDCFAALAMTEAADNPEISDIPALAAAMTVHLPHWRLATRHNITTII
jgi:hypothetical protein